MIHMFTYSNAIKYLDSFTNYERIGLDRAKKEFDLGKVRQLLAVAGDPQRAYVPVHVAGTKGKGSVCAYISSIFTESGARTGLYTSPHLVSPRERIAVDGEIISKKDFADSVSWLKDAVESLGPGGDWTYFELLTVMAMEYFRKRAVDHAVFEVGVGGRLDATNVIEPAVAAITPISFDHMNVLGRSIEEIAREKAAVIKDRTACVSAPQRPEAMDVIEKRCAEKNATLTVVGKHLEYVTGEADIFGSVFDVKGALAEYKDCRTSLAGDFQPLNAAIAIGVCEKVLGAERLSGPAVKRGIGKAFIPGRMEVLGREPLLIIDGAHNEESAEKLCSSVKKINTAGKVILIAGFSRDKDIAGMCRAFGELSDTVIITRSSSPRAADPYVVRGYFRLRDKEVAVTGDVKEALGLALSKAGKKDMILVTGSFFVIGEVRKMLVGGDE